MHLDVEQKFFSQTPSKSLVPIQQWGKGKKEKSLG